MPELAISCRQTCSMSIQNGIPFPFPLLQLRLFLSLSLPPSTFSLFLSLTPTPTCETGLKQHAEDFDPPPLFDFNGCPCCCFIAVLRVASVVVVAAAS